MVLDQSLGLSSFTNTWKTLTRTHRKSYSDSRNYQGFSSMLIAMLSKCLEREGREICGQDLNLRRVRYRLEMREFFLEMVSRFLNNLPQEVVGVSRINEFTANSSLLDIEQSILVYYLASKINLLQRKPYGSLHPYSCYSANDIILLPHWPTSTAHRKPTSNTQHIHNPFFDPESP